MWSAQQQSMLHAMGYTLYVRPQVRLADEKEALAPAANRAPMPSSDSTLFQAIMNAAKGRDISALGIDLNALQTSPLAKRALWPRLREILKQQ